PTRLDLETALAQIGGGSPSGADGGRADRIATNLSVEHDKHRGRGEGGLTSGGERASSRPRDRGGRRRIAGQQREPGGVEPPLVDRVARPGPSGDREEPRNVL